MEFQIDKTDGNARACTITTAHSTIQTPVFMPVGTVGSVKSLDAIDMSEMLGAKIILGNTELNAVLSKVSKNLPHDIVAIIQHTHKNDILNQNSILINMALFLYFFLGYL